MTYFAGNGLPCKAAAPTDLRDGIGRLFFSAPRTLMLWYERHRQRRHLARLDERLLRDIGIDRADAMREVSKPFWQA